MLTMMMFLMMTMTTMMTMLLNTMQVMLLMMLMMLLMMIMLPSAAIMLPVLLESQTPKHSIQSTGRLDGEKAIHSTEKQKQRTQGKAFHQCQCKMCCTAKEEIKPKVGLVERLELCHERLHMVEKPWSCSTPEAKRQATRDNM